MSSLPIKNYDMDPTISGKVLTYMLESRGISLTQAEKDTGIPYDTLRKCLRGEVRMVSLDRILKICYITDYTIYDYFKMYFDAEQTAVFDKVVNVCATGVCPKKDFVKSADHPEKSADHVCHGVANLREHLDALQHSHFERMSQQYTDQLGQMKEQYSDTISLLNDRYERSVQHLKDEIEKLEEEKKDEIEKLENANKELCETLDKKNKRMRWLIGIMIVENIALFIVFLIDYFNRSIGWLRSFYDNISLHTITRG